MTVGHPPSREELNQTSHESLVGAYLVILNDRRQLREELAAVKAELEEWMNRGPMTANEALKLGDERDAALAILKIAEEALNYVTSQTIKPMDYERSIVERHYLMHKKCSQALIKIREARDERCKHDVHGADCYDCNPPAAKKRSK